MFGETRMNLINGDIERSLDLLGQIVAANVEDGGWVFGEINSIMIELAISNNLATALFSSDFA